MSSVERTYRKTEQSPRTGLPSQSVPFEEDRSPPPRPPASVQSPTCSLCADPLSVPVSTSLQSVSLQHYEWTLQGIARRQNRWGRWMVLGITWVKDRAQLTTSPGIQLPALGCPPPSPSPCLSPLGGLLLPLERQPGSSIVRLS